MNLSTATDLTTAIKAIASNHELHLPIAIQTHAQTEGEYEIKVFETDANNTYTYESLFRVDEYVKLSEEFNTTFMVKIEWRDIHDRKNKPYFLFF